MPADEFYNRYNKLNEKQRQAVDAIEGPLLVVAGPGSGKTELLALRIANILKETQTSPDSILCITFTDNGAVNMRERLGKIIGITAHKVAIYTFHSFARRIIDEYREYFYNAFELDVAGDVDKEEILDTAFRGLPHSSPLSSYHSKLGWAYYKDVKNRIRDIKMAGYNSSQYQMLVDKSVAELDIVTNIFIQHWTQDRMNVKNLAWLEALIKDLNIKDNLTALAYRRELENVYNQALEIGKAEPISNWSASNIIKNKNDNLLIVENKSKSNISLKEYENIEKTKDLAKIYSYYEQELYNRGLYDYDDMIIDVKAALYNNKDLRDGLAEKYMYIMIDEFQDTSNAQMDLILALTDHEAHHGAPNICAVGDDDQAIYKFQGAEINNIINYRANYWRDVKVITLDINYRSTQDIIDISQKVASQASHRLDKVYKDINKNLRSSDTTSVSEIKNRYFKSKEIQYAKISQEIESLLKEANKKNEDGLNDTDITISIIARDHKSLKEMSKYLDKSNVAYDYVYKQNALTLSPIRDILNVMQYIASTIGSNAVRDDLLVNIISAPYWNIKRETIYAVAYKAKTEHITWWEAMSKINEKENIEVNSVEVNNMKNALLNIIDQGTDMPIIQMLHKVETELGIREYYFSNSTNRQQYYTYLEALRALYNAIEERDTLHGWTILNIRDFIEIYDKYKITLNINNTSRVSQVTLQTAHKSKGLEYDYVYIIDADDKIWNKKKRTNIASIPKFLHQILTSVKEDEDDSIRLLYVSMTRAKRYLYLSHVEERNRHIPETENSKFTNDYNDLEDSISALETSLTPAIYNIKEEEILRNILQNYQMSPTHMNNYLKVEEGGPAHFFKENLLRFPKTMSSSAAYGSAIHDAIESIFTTQKIENTQTENTLNTKNIKNKIGAVLLEGIINKFRISLSKKRLEKIEDNKLYNRGVKVLTNFYKKKIETVFQKETPKKDKEIIKESNILNEYSQDEFLIEYNLSHENIIYKDDILNIEAHITGKLDYAYIVDNKVNVLDWKTGKTLNSWDKGLDANDKVKAHRYKYQLMMYRLLIERSNRFKSYSIGDLGLQFIEDENIFTLYYEHNEEEYSRFKKLLIAVWKAINNLEFDESTEYTPKSDYEILKLEDLIMSEDKLIDKY